MSLLLLGGASAWAAGRWSREASIRRAGPRVGAALLVTAAVRLMAGSAESTQRYLIETTYLGKLFLGLVLAASLAAALPRETRDLVARLRACPWLRRHGALAAFLPCALVAVYAAETAVWGHHRQISGTLIVANALLLVAVTCALFGAIGRPLAALVVSSASFAALAAADAVKLRFLHDLVHPRDVVSVDPRLLVSLFGLRGAAVVAFALALAAVALYGSWHVGATIRARLVAGLLGVASLLAVTHLEPRSSTAALLGRLGVESPLVWSPRRAPRNGLLLDFLLRWSDFSVAPRNRYSEDLVAGVLGEYAAPAPPREAPMPGPPADLIVYMIESFMDPDDLGLRFTSDPVPSFHAALRAHPGGSAISPVFGGVSANAEFELLTGLATFFLPPGSIPYNDFLDRPVPSLATQLKRFGYRSVALHADSFRYYNEARVYPRLGFDAFASLADRQDAADLDAAGRMPSDEAMVDAVIAESRKGSPYFVFAFPEATHVPWDYPQYSGSDLDVIDSGLSAPDRDELKTYLNALRASDRALGRMLAHFAASDRRTVIAVLGDHLPALSGPPFLAGAFARDVAPRDLERQHRSPVLVWSNVPGSGGTIFCSYNFLGARLLRAAGIEPSGLFAVNERLESRLPVLSTYVRTARGELLAADAVGDEDRALLDAFATLQYDVLLGRQYALKRLGSQ